VVSPHRPSSAFTPVTAPARQSPDRCHRLRFPNRTRGRAVDTILRYPLRSVQMNVRRGPGTCPLCAIESTATSITRDDPPYPACIRRIGPVDRDLIAGIIGSPLPASYGCWSRQPVHRALPAGEIASCPPATTANARRSDTECPCLSCRHLDNCEA